MQGQVVLKQQDQQISAALQTAFVVNLGGSAAAAKRWGKCLAVRADGGLAQIRSSLGNALAHASAAKGLRAIAAVAYIEVCFVQRLSVCIHKCNLDPDKAMPLLGSEGTHY